MPTSSSAATARCRASLRLISRCVEHGFGQLIADAQKRIERGQRILKHHADLLAAQAAHGFALEVVDAGALQPDLAGDMGRRGSAGR